MELTYESPRVQAFDEAEQEQMRHDDAILLEEDRLRATVHVACYEQALCGYHSRQVHAWSFE